MGSSPESERERNEEWRCVLTLAISGGAQLARLLHWLQAA